AGHATGAADAAAGGRTDGAEAEAFVRLGDTFGLVGVESGATEQCKQEERSAHGHFQLVFGQDAHSWSSRSSLMKMLRNHNLSLWCCSSIGPFFGTAAFLSQ